MPWPESRPIWGEDVAFADSAAQLGGPPTDVESFLVAARSANATSSPLIGHDSGHRI